jgi:hypothetical protein
MDDIHKSLQNRPTISFRDERGTLERDIQTYVCNALSEVREQFPSHRQLLDHIGNKIIAEANGKCEPIESNYSVALLAIGMFL